MKDDVDHITFSGGEESMRVILSMFHGDTPSEYLAEALRAEEDGDYEAIAAEARYARELEESEAEAEAEAVGALLDELEDESDGLEGAAAEADETPHETWEREGREIADALARQRAEDAAIVAAGGIDPSFIDAHNAVHRARLDLAGKPLISAADVVPGSPVWPDYQRWLARREPASDAPPEFTRHAEALAAVQSLVSPSAFNLLRWAMHESGRDYRPYFSMLEPMIWADKARLTPEQWQGLFDFVQARGLAWEAVFS